MEEQQTPAEKDTPLSSQVLEYYRNFSQSHQLPRYLCGEVPHTSGITARLQELGETGDNNPNVNISQRPPLIGQDRTLTNILPPTVIITDVNADNKGQVSPTSSITSNRKLEWDNGADIGYENCEVASRNLFRSSSLPALNTLERNIQKDFLRLSPDGRIAETPLKNIMIRNSDSSTDSSTKIPVNCTTSTTNTANDDQDQRAINNSQRYCATMSSKLAQKMCASSSSSESYNWINKDENIIYMPVIIHSPPLAESTPNIHDNQSSKDTIYYETPIMVHPRKPPRKNAILSKAKAPQQSKSTSFDDLLNIQKLDETLAERDKYFQKYLPRKQQHLSITKPTSVEYINKSVKHNISIAIQTENIQTPKKELIYLDHCVSDKEDSCSTDNSSKIVDCNSFEYLYGSAIQHEEKAHLEATAPTEAEIQLNNRIDKEGIVEDFIPNKLKHSKGKSDLINITSTTTTSSESNSAKISSKLSNNLISDVDKSVDVLTKLLNSKKYDEDTKKYYIRKIVRKIVDSKYVDDRTTTNNSSTPSNKTTNESNTSEVPEENNHKEPMDSTINPQLTTVKREIKSETNLQEIADIHPRLQRNPRFTLTNNEFFVGHNKGDDNDNTSSDLFRPHSRHVFPSYTTDSSAEKIGDTNRSSTSRSWKDDKTVSEQLMESQKPIIDDSDELVGFAQRERQSQLNWISNEINHLSKLKSLLEKTDYKPSATQSTAVYMITTDKNGRGSSRQSCNCHNRLNIPNVISATKTPGHHHIKLQHCNHNQQEYRVRQVNCNQNHCIHRENASSCPYNKLCARKYRRTGLPSTSTLPTSSEDHQEYSIRPCNEQNFQQHYVPDDMDCRNGNLASTSTGVTCTLLPTTAATVASEPNKNIPEIAKNVRKSYPKQIPNIAKSSSAPTSISSPPKKRPVKMPVQSELSNRNVAICSSPKEFAQEGVVNKAKLISSDVYQNSEKPAASVRRYVFEIPIVDLQSNREASSDRKKSSDSGGNQKNIDLHQVGQVDFEVRNVHEIRDDKDKRRTSSTSDQNKTVKTNTNEEMKQNKGPNSEGTSNSVSGKVLSHNIGALFDIGPSISRAILTESSGETISAVSDKDVPIKSNDRNKITQTVEVRLKENEKILETKANMAKKNGGSANIDVELKRNSGSQTISLENYMKKLIAETMENTSWTRRRLDTDGSKTSTGSDKESYFQENARNTHNIRKTDASSKRKQHQKGLNLKTETSTTSDYILSLNPIRKTSEGTNEHDINSLEYKKAIDDRKKRIDDDISSVVFVPKGSINLGLPRTDWFLENHKRSSVETNNERKNSAEGQRKDSTLNQKKSSVDNDRISLTDKQRKGSTENERNMDNERKGSTEKDRKTSTDKQRKFSTENERTSLTDNQRRDPADNQRRGSTKNEKRSTLDKQRRGFTENQSKAPSENDAPSKLSGFKSNGRPDSIALVSNLDETPRNEEGSSKEETVKIPEKYIYNETVSKVKYGKEDKKTEILKSIQNTRHDPESNSSESKATSDISSPISTLDDTIKICQCCQSNNISLDNIFAEAIHHPLCQTCYQIHQYSLWRDHKPFYMCPSHICNCYTLIKTRQIQAIKATINQLQSLENKHRNVCSCPPHKKLPQQDNKCLSCDCPIKASKKHHHHHRESSTTRKYSSKSHDTEAPNNQSAISYTVKLETATEEDVEEEHTGKPLGRYEEEVILKVPGQGISSLRKASVDNKGQHQNMEQNDGGEEKENDSGKPNNVFRRNKRKISNTLQEYLTANRPNFIESAEQRRKCLIELAYMREARCQKYKQLLAMTSGVPVLPNQMSPQHKGLTPQKPRIFSTKEMKRLTAKNYKKLPEVQQRMQDNKEKQLKKANRLLSDIFNKKLRAKVLKGQPSLSTSVSVINLM